MKSQKTCENSDFWDPKTSEATALPWKENEDYLSAKAVSKLLELPTAREIYAN